MTIDEQFCSDPTAAYAALSQLALADRPLDETFAEVAGVAREVLPEASVVSVTLLTEDRPRTVAWTGEVALELDRVQYAENSGPCLDAALSGGAIQVAVDLDGPYPDYRQAAGQAGVTHSLSVGIPAGGRVAGAALNVYSEGSGPFTVDSARAAKTLAAFAGYALAARRPDEAATAAVRLREAVASRAVVKQAQGVLTQQLHCSFDEAFARLVELARQRGVRLHEAARAVVDQQAGPAAPG